MSDRRRRGAGTVEKKGDRWRFRTPDGAGNRYSSPAIYESPELARLALAEYRLAITSRKLVPVHGMTLREFVADFWADAIRLEQPRSAPAYLSRWRAKIDPGLGHVVIPALTRRMVLDWAKSPPMRKKSADITIGTLRKILDAAIERTIIDENPAKDVKAVQIAKDPNADEGKTPTPEEQEAFIRAVPVDAAHIARFARRSGLRPGEWRNLHLVDVHVAADELEPRVFVRWGGNEKGGKLTPPKRNKVRFVPLFGDALDAVREWLLILPTFAPENPLGLLFPLANGRRRDSCAFGRVWVKVNGKAVKRSLWPMLLKAAGITKAFKPHGFRHATATDLQSGENESGVQWEPRAAQGLLGHSQLSMTEAYTRKRSSVATKAAKASDDAFRAKIGPQSVPGAETVEANPAESQGKWLGHLESNQDSRLQRVAPLSAVISGTCAGSDPLLGTDRGLIEELHALLAGMVAGRYPTAEAAAEFGRRVSEARLAWLLESDAVLAAAGRASGDRYLYAVVELARLLLPDVAKDDAAVRRG